MKLQKALLLGVLTLGLSMPAWADESMLSRLKDIEEKQDAILLKLDNVLQELAIVKVRATR